MLGEAAEGDRLQRIEGRSAILAGRPDDFIFLYDRGYSCQLS